MPNQPLPHYFELRHTQGTHGSNASGAAKTLHKQYAWMAGESLLMAHHALTEHNQPVAVAFTQMTSGLFCNFGPVVRFYASTTAGLAFVRECLLASYDNEIQIAKTLELTEIAKVPQDVVGWAQFLRYRVKAKQHADPVAYLEMMAKAQAYPLTYVPSSSTGQMVPLQVMLRLVPKSEEHNIVARPNGYGLASKNQFRGDDRICATPVFAGDALASKFC